MPPSARAGFCKRSCSLAPLPDYAAAGKTGAARHARHTVCCRVYAYNHVDTLRIRAVCVCVCMCVFAPCPTAARKRMLLCPSVVPPRTSILLACLPRAPHGMDAAKRCLHRRRGTLIACGCLAWCALCYFPRTWCALGRDLRGSNIAELPDGIFDSLAELTTLCVCTLGLACGACSCACCCTPVGRSLGSYCAQRARSPPAKFKPLQQTPCNIEGTLHPSFVLLRVFWPIANKLYVY